MTTDTDPLTAVARLLERYTPAQLRDVMRTFEPDDIAIVERVLAERTGEGWRSSPAAMGAHLNPAFVRYRYIDLLSDRFVDAVTGKSPRQIWALPARYGKTLLGSILGPTWAFEHDPAIKIILSSYGDELATENATAVRDNLVLHGDILQTRLRKDQRRARRFVTEQGGGLAAAGIGSALTGFGADLAIIDDPFKNWQEAHSEARRLHVWNWYRAVLRLRLNQDDSAILIIATRWHEDDLTGRLLTSDLADEGENWDYVRLPALAEDDDDPLGRKRGEPIEPLRFSLQAVLARARALGTYLSSGLEQQRPAPEEGTDIMRGWWRWYDQAPPRFDDALVSVDTKMKDREGGDFVVVQTWGRTGSDFWCVDQLRGQWNFAVTKTALVLMAVRHPFARRFVVENTGNGPEVMDQLRRPQPGYSVGEDIRSQLGITDDELPKVDALFRRGMSGLLAENPKGDKRSRMRAYTPLIEAGNVHLPLRTSWAEGLVDEAATFPNGSHDDQVDALSQALKRLSGGRGSASRPKGTIQTPKPSARSARPNGMRVGGSVIRRR